jgi:hypothetical protein
MKRAPLLAILWLLLLVPLPSSASPRTETWTSVRSENFVLVGDTSPREMRQVASRLERFREVFSRLFPEISSPPAMRTTVIVFGSDAEFQPFKPLYHGQPVNVAGFFQPGQGLNYITLTTESRADNPYRTIFHEYVHLLLNSREGRIPHWLGEGLAEYFSTFDIKDGDRSVLLGKPIPAHAQLLRRGPLLPLRLLFSVDHDSPYYNERDKQSIFYAESWALVHYLLWANNDHGKSDLRRFLDVLLTSASAEDAFRQTFGTNYERIETGLEEYIRRNHFPVETIALNARTVSPAETQTAVLSEAQVEAHLGDLSLHTSRLDEADARLGRALVLDPKLAMAHASLGLLRARQKPSRSVAKAWTTPRLHLATRTNP